MLKQNPIKYANCWEDADVLLEALSPHKGSNILSIGSGGDNSFALLSTEPKKITIVDYNIHQLYLIELKKIAFQALEYNDLKKFLGFEYHPNRLQYFYQLQHLLSSECKTFWMKNKAKIDRGVIYSGKFENYFHIYKKWIQPLMASKHTIAKFFAGSQTKKEKEKYVKRFNNVSVKYLLKFYFSKRIMAKLGRSKAHFSHVKNSVSDYLINKLIHYILSDDGHENGFMRFISMGSFSNKLPFYMRKENYKLIKSNIDKIELVYGKVEKALSTKINYDYFNLSNIYEYMSIEEFNSIAQSFIQHAKTGAKFAYWNLFVSRKLSDLYSKEFTFNKSLSNTLHQKDKLFFYKNFILESRL